MIDAIVTIYNTVLYQPLFNILILLYNFIPGKDFGVAIIVLTLMLRLVLYPLSAKAFLAQKLFSELKPKIDALREKFKHDRDELARKTFEVYQKSGMAPFSGMGLLFVQLPILFAIFQVFSRGLQESQLAILYPFVHSPGVINSLFLGMVQLGEPSLVLALLAGTLQFFQMQVGLITSSSGISLPWRGVPAFGKKYFMPIFMLAFTFSILLRLPAAIGLYWVATTLFSIWQQWHLSRKAKTQNPNPKTQIA